MPTEFEKMTQVVVQEMYAGGNMIPAKRNDNSDEFHCLCLVTRKRTLFGYRYYNTGLTLADILEKEGDDEQISKVQVTRMKLQYQDQLDFQMSGKIPNNGIEGNFQKSHILDLDISDEHIPEEDLKSLANRKLKENLPETFRDICEKREDLYLVTKVLKNEKKQILKNSWKFNLWNKFKCAIIDFVLKCVGNKQKEVPIPANRVLAYKMKQLLFDEGKMNIDFQGKEKKKSFRNEKGGPAVLGRSLASEDSGNLDFRDVNFLKEMVQDMEKSLEDLTEKEKEDVLECLTTCLRDIEQLQNLKQRVSEVQESGELLTEEGPADSLIQCLFSDAGTLLKNRTETILNVLDALMELSEELQLVDEILLKNEILSQLKEQMESILEQNLEQPHNVDHKLEVLTLCALYIVVSIMGQLSGQLLSESS